MWERRSYTLVLKCSYRKSWYYNTNYILALPLPCCVLCPLYTALLLDFPAICNNFVCSWVQVGLDFTMQHFCYKCIRYHLFLTSYILTFFCFFWRAFYRPARVFSVEEIFNGEGISIFCLKCFWKKAMYGTTLLPDIGSLLCQPLWKLNKVNYFNVKSPTLD